MNFKIINITGKAERNRKKKGFQLRGDSDYEIVGELCPQQQQGNTWQQRVAKLFRWVPQFPEIPWRTSKKTQHNEKSVSPPSQFVTSSEKSNSKDKLCLTGSELSNYKDKLCVTRSEVLKHHNKDDMTNCDSSRLSNMKDNSCLRINIQDRMKRRTDGSSSGQEEVSTISSQVTGDATLDIDSCPLMQAIFLASLQTLAEQQFNCIHSSKTGPSKSCISYFLAEQSSLISILCMSTSSCMVFATFFVIGRHLVILFVHPIL